MQLPTIDEMFRQACDQLDAIDRQLSHARDWLNSDWSDNRHLTPKERDRRDMMQEQIAAAKLAVQQAKTRPRM